MRNGIDVATRSATESAHRAAGRGRASIARAELTEQLVRLETSLRYSASRMSDAVADAAEQARVMGAVDLQLRVQLIQGDVMAREGHTAAGARLIREVNRWADEHGHRPLLARSHRYLSSVLRAIGDCPTSLEHAVRAMELTDDDVHPRVRIDHLLTLGIALASTRDFDAAGERFAAAERAITAIGDDMLLAALMNNVAYTHHMAGQPDDALAAARRMRDIHEARREPMNATFLDTLGQVLIAAGEPAVAAAVLEDGLRATDELADPDSSATCLLTLAEAQRALGSLEAAHGALDACLELCAERELAEVAVRVSEVRAQILAAQGRFREAYEQQVRFTTASTELFARERNSRAKVLQAIFETDEARRDSERFRLMSLYDPLTGLHNRRFVNERLPALLGAAEEAGTPVSVAIVDLDHFKQVNDRCGHDAGDAVLVVVAAMLTQATPEGGFTARLGGEEFLLVLPDTDAEGAVQLCEGVRASLRAHDWQPIAGDQTVTGSFGVATSDARNATHLTLLQQADARLYLAKSSGRDRVIAQG